jgi:hypothetical protein
MKLTVKGEQFMLSMMKRERKEVSEKMDTKQKLPETNPPHHPPIKVNPLNRHPFLFAIKLDSRVGRKFSLLFFCGIHVLFSRKIFFTKRQNFCKSFHENKFLISRKLREKTHSTANFVYWITKNIGKESEQHENDVGLQQI